MSVSLTVVGGHPAVEITDHKGEVWAYPYEVLADDDRLFRVRLCKRDGADEPEYEVTLGRGWQRCECKDWQIRRRRTGESCKHLAAVKDLRELLTALRGGATVSEARS